MVRTSTRGRALPSRLDPTTDRKGRALKATNSADAVPKPRTPGPEMEELARFYRDVTWRGTIEPGAMGPGSPPMTGIGEDCTGFLHGGLWIAGDYEQDQ
jgi:hypothetical protein